jgi:hypothetical protein
MQDYEPEPKSRDGDIRSLWSVAKRLATYGSFKLVFEVVEICNFTPELK